ncbi:MAG: M3 family metallopeptidase [Burkholderiales bacterium]|nr:M3 family metallopeptidase [Burkholderiales bacterium]
MKIEANPLLDFSGLPRFAAVKPEHVAPAIDLLLADCRAAVAGLIDPATPATWDDFVAPLDDVNERLTRAWGVVAHLHGVLDSPALREAYNANQPKVVQYWTELGHNERLFAKYQALRASAEYARLDAAQQRIVDHELRDFRLAGAELPPGEKKRFAEIQEELATLGTRFSENVLDATNAFALYVEDRAELAGIPDDVLEGAREAAARDGREGWKLTLQAPSYVPVMQYADSRRLRERVYHAYNTRASEEYPRALAEASRYECESRAGTRSTETARAPAADAARALQWDNTPLIARILRLRKEAARLLGYASYAEVSLVPKMAESPHVVLDFLCDLAARSLPFARRDYAELREFAAAELGLGTLEVWDIAYASEKLRQQRYAYSEHEVKQYFPEPKVLEGMFRLVQTLYGIRIAPDEAETWHPDVRFFRITDADGALVGQLYFDPHARESKRGGAWMDEAMARRRRHTEVQTPVAYLECNFPSPVGGKPALFTHDDVITLFHEFGHGLHHLLTRVDYLGASGIHGVEWDAVELPSQFMENFCWEWEVLQHMTAHVESNAPLPRSLFDKMVAAKNFQAGMQMVRQLEFALFDMRLHDDFDPDGARTPLALLEEVRREVAVVVLPAYNRFPNSFSHIFGGGYAAGYYSYKWAEVLSADAYSLFEENGVLDRATGWRFRDEILAVGGARPALESFKLFRGREPKVDALLKHNGMIVA